MATIGGDSGNRGYKLAEVMEKDPARYKRFLDNLRLGCTVTAAAEGVGVSSSAAHRAISRGRGKDAPRELKKLARDVYQAISAARILSEAEVRVADPKWWLMKGPGRMLGNEWDMEQEEGKDNNAESASLSTTDIIKGLIELRRSGMSIDGMIDDGSIHTLAPSQPGAAIDGMASHAVPAPRPLAGAASFLASAPALPAPPPPSAMEPSPTPLGVSGGAGVNGESSNPIPPTLPKPKTRRVPVYTLKDGTPLGDYDPPNITKVEPLPKNVKNNIKLTSPKDIGVDGYKNVVEIVQNGDGYSENSPSIDRTIEGSHDLVAQSCNMENNTGQSTEDLLKNLELANQRRSERKMIQQMEKEELEELEDSLPDGLRRFLLNEGN